MSRFLILPDVHHRVEIAERAIARFPGHQPIFLGDYFDDYNDTVEDARRTAEWLRRSLGQGRIHLMGNHDLPYRWSHLDCPGHTQPKHAAVNKILRPEDWNEVRLAFILRGKAPWPVVLSHAGITVANLYGVEDFRDTARGGRLAHLRDRSVDEHLDEIRIQFQHCKEAADAGGHHFWLNRGSRMGERDTAGPFWLDRHDFNPITGINQIVGHTQVLTPQCHHLPNSQASTSKNWFIDTKLKHAALVENGIIRIEELI
jgi:hypothetical protein